MDIKIEQNLLDYVGGLQEIVRHYYEVLPLRPNYRREGHIFRANTNFMSKAWRDWVIIDWGGAEGNLPCHLMGFVDLTDLPHNNGLVYGTSGELDAAIYAIVEVAQPIIDDDYEVRSELFVAYAKEVGGFTGKFVSHNKYYLADVEAIVGPASIIPDVGGAVNHYLHLKDRSKWRKDFERWLERPSAEDEVYESEHEDDAQDRINYEEMAHESGESEHEEEE